MVSSAVATCTTRVFEFMCHLCVLCRILEPIVEDGTNDECAWNAHFMCHIRASQSERSPAAVIFTSVGTGRSATLALVRRGSPTGHRNSSRKKRYEVQLHAE